MNEDTPAPGINVIQFTSKNPSQSRLSRNDILRATRFYPWLGILLAMGAACSNPGAAQPAAAGVPVPYDEFADLQYYRLKGTHTIVIELYDGSGTSIVDIECELQKSAPILLVRIYGNKTGPETKKLSWNTEGNAVYSFDAGNVDTASLRVVYDDGKGGRDIPAAGIVDKPFELEHPEPAR